MSAHKIWFSLFDLTFDYKGDELPFQSPHDFRWTKDFEMHYEDIYAELQQFLSKNNPSP